MKRIFFTIIFLMAVLIGCKENTMNTFDKQLQSALSGMTYPSEGDDQPLERFRYPTMLSILTPADVRQWSGETGEIKATTSYVDFMEPRMASGEQATQYENLDGIMTGGLTHLMTVTFGTVNVNIYVAGLDANGNIVGWKTSAVQT